MVDRVGRGLTVPGGVTLPEATRDAVRGERSAPELTLQGTETLSQSIPAAEGRGHWHKLPAAGWGPWQQQLRAQEAGGRY